MPDPGAEDIVREGGREGRVVRASCRAGITCSRRRAATSRPQQPSEPSHDDALAAQFQGRTTRDAQPRASQRGYLGRQAERPATRLWTRARQASRAAGARNRRAQTTTNKKTRTKTTAAAGGGDGGGGGGGERWRVGCWSKKRGRLRIVVGLTTRRTGVEHMFQCGHWICTID